MQKKEQLQLSFVFPIIKLYFRKSNYDSSHIKKISCKTFEKDSFQFEMSVVLALFGKKMLHQKTVFFVWLARKSFNCVEFSKKYGNWKTEGWVRTETVSSQKRRILGTLKFMHNR